MLEKTQQNIEKTQQNIKKTQQNRENITKLSKL